MKKIWINLMRCMLGCFISLNLNVNKVVYANDNYFTEERFEFESIDNSDISSLNLTSKVSEKIGITIEGNPLEWVNTDVTLKLIVIDSENIVKKIVLPDGNVTTHKELGFSVSSNGEYTFKIVNIYGEEIIKSVNVTKIDKDLPKIKYKIDVLGEKERRIEVYAYDELSGIDSIVDTEGNILDNIDTIVFNAECNGNYLIIAIDKANNENILNINIDDINDDNVIGKERSDAVSGIEKIEYKVNSQSSWTRYTKEINFSDEGIYTIYAKATDKAGNESSIEQAVLKIDKSIPYLVYAIKYNQDNTKADITLVGVDDLSGMRNFVRGNESVYNSNTYTFTVSNNGVYMVTAYDNAGNVAIASIEVSGLNGQKVTSGIQWIEYKLEGATNQGWTTYKNSIAIIQEGTTIVTARSYDNAGNVSSEVKLEVKIDKTKPNENRISVKPIK